MPISNPSLPLVPDGVEVDDLTLDTVRLLITARTMAAQACCQACGRASARVHSRYWRTFKNLPCQDRAVTWRVQVRRFRCGHWPSKVRPEKGPGHVSSLSPRSSYASPGGSSASSPALRRIVGWVG